MNSDDIFEYSNDFLNEIIDDCIKLKFKKNTDIRNLEFENKLKGLLGKKYKWRKNKRIFIKVRWLFKKRDYKSIQSIRDDRIKEIGEEQAKEIEKRIFLQSIDINWKSHIQYLEQLRQVIGLRSYGQRDPLVEYKKEAFTLFEVLLDKLKIDFITLLLNLKVVRKTQEKPDMSKSVSNDPKCLLLLKKNEKISRNERCEATGKKYKNCCGAL